MGEIHRRESAECRLYVVLKDERRQAYKDAYYIFKSQEPALKIRGKDKEVDLWDEGFGSWEGLGKGFRIVYLRERYKEGRKEKESTWVWMTKLKKDEVSTEGIWRIGHKKRYWHYF